MGNEAGVLGSSAVPVAQAIVLHAWVLAPLQLVPPQDGAGLVQVLVWVPPPQLTLHPLHSDQPPLTGLHVPELATDATLATLATEVALAAEVALETLVALETEVALETLVALETEVALETLVALEVEVAKALVALEVLVALDVDAVGQLQLESSVVGQLEFLHIPPVHFKLPVTCPSVPHDNLQVGAGAAELVDVATATTLKLTSQLPPPK